TLYAPTDTPPTCPYTGAAAYWTYRGAGGAGADPRTDVVWAYPQPKEKVAEIKDHLSFYDAAAEIEVSQ
ncbi:DUF427 domain-containing protein, partial [Streptomyces hygroscopicus]|uniref:DUF427 domain-containing protein n=1 Tax=Streptomyces hygroscopicus TaxID=1912 RepID=UPI003680FEBD